MRRVDPQSLETKEKVNISSTRTQTSSPRSIVYKDLTSGRNDNHDDHHHDDDCGSSHDDELIVSFSMAGGLE